MSDQIPAAWYPDPDDNGKSERWWDGHDWTDHTRATFSARTSPPPPQAPAYPPSFGPAPTGPAYSPAPPPVPFAPPRQPKRGIPTWVWIVGAIIVIVVIVSAISSSSGNNDSAVTAPSPAAPDSTEPTTAPSSDATAEPSKAATPVVLLDTSGSGAQTTAKFTTGTDDWDLAYTYDCTQFGGTGNFIVDIYQSDGTPSFDNNGANELGAGAIRLQHFHTGGTFYLTINSECTWHVKALTVS
jgi:hypothetical protein